MGSGCGPNIKYEMFGGRQAVVLEHGQRDLRRFIGSLDFRSQKPCRLFVRGRAV